MSDFQLEKNKYDAGRYAPIPRREERSVRDDDWESLWSDQPMDSETRTEPNRLALFDPLAGEERFEDRLFRRMLVLGIAAIAMLLSAFLGYLLGTAIYQG